MVAAEERKMTSRRSVITQGKGKENKDKIVSESKSAGQVDYAEAEEIERKNREKQAHK